MAEQVQKDSAESLRMRESSNSDDSLIHPVGLTSSRRRRILSSESELGENSGTAIAGWEEVFQDTDNPPEAHYKFNEIPGPNHTLPRAAAPIAYFYLFFTNILLETIVGIRMSIDESLMGTKNHTQLLQYLPNKHHHWWRIKLWMLCNSVSNYCLAFYIYRGAQSAADRFEIQENGLAHTVVMKLLTMGNYFSRSYHIFDDNFFASVSLAKTLYGLGTYITGTIRRNRKFISEPLTEKFAIGVTKFFRQGPFLTICYREKKSQRFSVILLSSKSKAQSTTHFRTRRGQTEETVKPFAIECYNNYMGGIDTSDMMLYTYLDERQTVKYWKKVCFNVFSRMMLNSYIIYKESLPSEEKPITRFRFMISIVETLAKEWESAKKNSGAESNKLEKLPGEKEKDCCVCSTRSKDDGGKRRRIQTICSICKKGLHGACFPQHRCNS
nr:piggyBac transposable element-derived protein 4-like [Nomia melanderi]